MVLSRKPEIDREISKKLDILIRLYIESLLRSDDNNFNIGQIARILKTMGISPTEIAKLLGKKSVTSIAPHLYQRTRSLKI